MRASQSGPGAGGASRSISASLNPLPASAAARLAPTSPAPTMTTSTSTPGFYRVSETSTYHPESKRQPGKVEKRVLRMISGVKVLGGENQQPSRNHVDQPGRFPELAGVVQPVVAPVFDYAGVLPRRLRVRFVDHQRVRFPEAEERRAARALVGTVQIDDTGERAPDVSGNVVMRKSEITAFLVDLHEPVDVDGRILRLRRGRVDRLNGLRRDGDHAVGKPHRETKPAIVVIDEVASPFHMLPVRCGSGADDRPCLGGMFEEIVDDDRRNRRQGVLDGEIGVDVEQLVEEEWLHFQRAAGSFSGAPDQAAALRRLNASEILTLSLLLH